MVTTGPAGVVLSGVELVFEVVLVLAVVLRVVTTAAVVFSVMELEFEVVLVLFVVEFRSATL